MKPGSEPCVAQPIRRCKMPTETSIVSVREALKMKCSLLALRYLVTVEDKYGAGQPVKIQYVRTPDGRIVLNAARVPVG